MTAEIPGGYILLSRKLLASGIMQKPALYLKLWVWMLLQATHTGRGNLKRGQFRCSIDEMREALGYKIGYRIDYPTIKEIRRAYGFMTEAGMIETKKILHGMIVSILNYDSYQNPDNYETRCPKQGHNGGHNEGHNKKTKNPCKQEPESLPDINEGHDERRDDAPNRGTIKTRMYNKNYKRTPADFLNRYAGGEQALIEKTLQAIATTRKTGNLSDSKKASILQQLEKYDRQQVLAGCRTYLEKEYPRQGKKEAYLFGIIRNQQARPGIVAAPGFVPTGSRALDEYYRNQQAAQGAA